MSDGSWRLGLLGHPVAHSLSPPLHLAALEATGQLGTYALVDCPPEGLAEALARLRGGEFDGLNATIPHKEALAGCVDRLARSAAALGAVNTLVRAPDGAIEGHNTDLVGLVSALKERWPETPWRWSPATVVGAGGAARAVASTLIDRGAAGVTLLNRTESRARAAADSLSGPVSVAPLTPRAFT
ncbi:MAG: shikimate dehydrogenase, partial [Myxococcota bacterium]|nr:shikimate dehydrogenase [Myxococcota bacterium]